MNSRATEPAVEARDVHKRFHDVEALRGLALTVLPGQIVGLLGPNGSGKTTFIRAVAGLVRIESGSVRVLGRAPRDAVAAGLVGYMTQSAALYQELSVEENLAFFAALRGIRDARAAIDEALGVVDVAARRRSLITTLSGGMRQRVSLAIALLGRPPLLLLDEPTVGVDPALRREFWSFFKTLTSQGTAILVSSHVMDEAERCDRLALIRSGRVIADGSVSEIRERAGTSDLEEAFLRLSERPA